MRKFLIGLILIFILFPFLVSAATYYVSPSGSDSNSGTSVAQAWRSIGKANSNLQPGDTVYIRAGTYSEQIRPSRSGSSGNYITYQSYQGEEVTITDVPQGIYLIGKDYIQIDGIKVYGGASTSDCCAQNGECYSVNTLVELKGSSYNIIKNGHFENCNAWFGVYIEGNSNYNKFLNNKIIGGYNPDDLIGIKDGPKHNLFEGNEIANGAHAAVIIRGQENVDDTVYNVFRNNKVTSKWHHCFLFNFADYTLFEGNEVKDCWGKEKEDNCGGSAGDRQFSPGSTGSFQGKGVGMILRRNTVIEGGYGMHPGSGTDYATYYHNTIYDTYKGFGYDSSYWAYQVYTKNNIIFESREYNLKSHMSGSSGNPHGYPNDQYFINNIFYEGALSYQGSSYSSLSQLESQNSKYFQGNIDANPQVTNKNTGDLTLTANSPAIDAADWLTKTTNTGSSSTTINLENAHFFTDGWGIIEGDLIQLQGQTTTARITNINYASNTITVNTPLTWSSGTGVTLAYEGSAPDIGAYEYGAAAPPSTCSGTCMPNQCTTYTDCTTGTGTCTSGMYCCSGTCTGGTEPPPTCSNCKPNPCNTYTDCTIGTGTCPTGQYCCSGTCSETPPPPQDCSDGTPEGECSATQPKYCENGVLVDKCSDCLCPTGTICNTNTEKCVECITPSDCNDNNDCTTDTCTSANTCSHSNVGDGTMCSNGYCCAGFCSALGNNNLDNECKLGPMCVGTSWEFVIANNGELCGGYQCRECNNGFCNFDDTSNCGFREVCTSGTCTKTGCTSDNDCTESNTPLCDMDTGRCVECLNTGDCDDTNECTTDNCVSNFCTHSNRGDGTSCNGGSGSCCTGVCVTSIENDDFDQDCRGGPMCVAGVLRYYYANNGELCGDFQCRECRNGYCNFDNTARCGYVNLCVAGTCSSNGCTSNSDCSATPNTPHCNTGTGQCVACLEAAHCNDSKECTTDNCVSDSCSFTNKISGTPCTTCGGDICECRFGACANLEGGGCSSDSDCSATPNTPFCNTDSGVCIECLNAGYCNDGNLCTIGSCISGSCSFGNVADGFNCSGCGDTSCECKSGSCVSLSCTPNCVGKACGDDGCGGICGSCTDDKVCNNGICVTPGNESPGDDTGSGSGCVPEWSCSEWGDCRRDGTKIRFCFKSNRCSGSAGMPATTDSCVYGEKAEKGVDIGVSRGEESPGVVSPDDVSEEKVEESEKSVDRGFPWGSIILIIIILGIGFFAYTHKEQIASLIEGTNKGGRPGAGAKAGKGLSLKEKSAYDYIQMNLKKGRSREQIRRSLINTGWAPAELDKLFKRFK